MDGEPTNQERAEQAFRAINNSSYYSHTAREDSTEGAIGDLMTDLLHLAAEQGIDAEVLLDHAARQFREEE